MRQAIENAAEGETIVIPAGIGTIALDSEELSVSHAVTIEGAGAASTVISGSGVLPVIAISGSITVSISGVTITDGLATEPGGIAEGGGISVSGATVTLSDSLITGNTADTSDTGTHPGGISEGGGIAARVGAHLTLLDTTVSGNRALADASGTGGGGMTEGGGLFVRESRSPCWAGGFAKTSLKAPAPRAVSSPGAVYYRGTSSTTATLQGLEVDGNRVVGDATSETGHGGNLDGGGIDLHEGSGPATLDDLTIAGNSLTGTGGSNGPGELGEGGGLSDGGPPTTLINGTVAGNSITNSGQGSAEAGSAGGGGIHIQGALMRILNSTIDGNVLAAGGKPAGPLTGGDIYAEAPGIEIENSIVAAGVAREDSNCNNGLAIASEGHNIDSLDACGFDALGDHVDADPLLGPLQNNGGPIETMPLLAGSPAIDGGEGAGCPATDARGVPRPQGAACDIGAYELAPASATTGVATGVGSTAATLSGSASNPDALGASVAFEFGKTTGYGSTTAQQAIGARSSTAAFGTGIAGLQPGTTYRFFPRDRHERRRCRVRRRRDLHNSRWAGPAEGVAEAHGARLLRACGQGHPLHAGLLSGPLSRDRGRDDHGGAAWLEGGVGHRGRRRHRTVTVGPSDARSPPARPRRYLELNALGCWLERRFEKLPVTLTVSLTLPGSARAVIERIHLTLAPPKKRKRH